MDLKLYIVDTSYIEYLKSNPRLHNVLDNKESNDTFIRKYIGVVWRINSFNYFAPLSSPKDTDYEFADGIKKIRKTVTPIMRIVCIDQFGNDELKGTIKFSNMIPVPDCALTPYIIADEQDAGYKVLVEKEYDFIRSNKESILKNAKVIYNQKTKEHIYYANGNQRPKYLDSTVDFRLAEIMLSKYQKSSQV